LLPPAVALQNVIGNSAPITAIEWLIIGSLILTGGHRHVGFI